MHDLVQFAQFKIREKHPWVFFTLIKLYKWYKIAKSVPNQTKT